MQAVTKATELVKEIKAYWKSPAKGDYVAYREFVMLSVGWLGMRLATVFGITFGVGNAFTGMTLHMTNRDLLIMSYICTAIGYLLAPLNAYIIDNLRSRSGKYRVYIKLAVPSAVLSFFALFFPYEKLGYLPMVISLFLIGQIQGYVQQWYNTGVSNLVYVMSPNSKERVRIMMVSSLVHNFAPSLTGLLMPILSDVLADGDLYNIRTYRMIYPAFIIIGTVLSLTAYFGVKERIVQPATRMTNVGFADAFKAVAHNKLFWIKATDSWNDFLEGAKNNLMQWVFYYGKVGSMTMYGILNTVSYNSSMWAMLVSPYLINRFGKRAFKLGKNILQVFIVLGLALTYKKSVWFIGIFFFLDRFCETSEVIDRSLESDIRDYQQYLSGERIDGAFGVINTYVGGAIGALTNLFIPWVYKKNGFDGTDYSVLEVYNSKGVYQPNNVLYSLLDVLLKISLLGAVVDIIPWIFYDLSETGQKSVIRVIRLRSALEDRAAGDVSDELYCEACEAVITAREYEGKEKRELPGKKADKMLKKSIRRDNEEIDIAAFLKEELSRFETDCGKKIVELSELIVSGGPDKFYENLSEILYVSSHLPEASFKAEKTFRRDAVNNARAIRRSKALIDKYYPDGLKEYTALEYEAVFNLPENNKKELKFKRAAIKEADKKRNTYGKAVKPYLVAKRNLMLNDGYKNIDAFLSDYDKASERLEKLHDERRHAEELEKQLRKEEAESRLKDKKLRK